MLVRLKRLLSQTCSASGFQARSATKVAILVVFRQEMITTYKPKAYDAAQDINGLKDQLGSVLKEVRETDI